MGIVFDQLRVSNDGQSLYIDAHVNQASYFDNVYIRKITICTESQVSELHPESYGSDFIYQQDIDVSSNLREIHLVLTKASFNEAFNNAAYNGEGKPYIDSETGYWARLDDTKPVALASFDAGNLSTNMFFVYIDTTPLPEIVPCSLGGETNLGVTLDYGVLYNKGMQYTKELADTCNISNAFIDYLLNAEALKLALHTCHYIAAIQHWKNLMKVYQQGTPSVPCPCHH